MIESNLRTPVALGHNFVQQSGDDQSLPPIPFPLPFPSPSSPYLLHLYEFSMLCPTLHVHSQVKKYMFKLYLTTVNVLTTPRPRLN